jgi:pimeloyl-ACP methyl ester carboxylesterase
MHYFASRGWTCYALNLRGHHLSDPVADWGAVGVDAYLEDVDTVITWIGKDLVLVGHSMGGVLAQKQAEKKNPRKLVLLHAAAPASAMKDIDFDAFLKRGKERGRVTRDTVVESDSDPQKLIGYMFDQGNVEQEVLLACHQIMGKESARALHEMQGVEVDASEIRCPVYVLGFDLRKIGLDYPVDLNRILSRYYNARDMQLIEPGGHLFMLEKNWEAFARLLEQWISD